MNPYFLNLFANISIILHIPPLFPTFFSKLFYFSCVFALKRTEIAFL